MIPIYVCLHLFIHPLVYLSACGVLPQCQALNIRTNMKVTHLLEPQSPLDVTAEPCPWGRNRWE